MRVILALAGIVLLVGGGLVALWASAAGSRPAADPSAHFRPQARVDADPAAWYSPALFQRKGEPQPGEWMAAHPEPPQSFDRFSIAGPVRPTVARHTIYLSPVGPMNAADVKRLEVLREFLEIYYTLPVKIGPPAGLEKVTHREREMGDLKFRQYLSTDILGTVLPPLLPKDAVCLQGVTMEDLYPDPEWNYVFGQASLGNRVGIYSLVRFFPAFWGEKAGPDAEKRALRRCLQVLVHETGHMFGVEHCQAYACLMNGSNSLPESDRTPLHLCPDCLKKFRWNIGFDVVDRYEALKKFYAAHDLAAEAEWVDKRLKECGPTPAAATKAP
jgi:archaemetzincin